MILHLQVQQLNCLWTAGPLMKLFYLNDFIRALRSINETYQKHKKITSNHLKYYTVVYTYFTKYSYSLRSFKSELAKNK